MSVIEDIWARMEEQAERQAAEVARLDAVRAKGYVPSEVGPEIPEAPARGPVRMVEMMASYPKGDDGFEVKPSGFMGRKTLQRADSFDVMAAKAARHKKPAPFAGGDGALLSRPGREACECGDEVLVYGKPVTTRLGQ